ncbi:hypothetical protein TW85_16625 [Marinomonas sp. S3726]|nr:hypothetical protein TW85_16625 [Marinomonas sp. S3726]
MTIKATVECDAYGCSNELGPHDPDESSSEISYANWREDPNNGYQHYCSQCWENVKKEFEELDDE